MARMPSTLGERAVPRATRRVASLDPSTGLSLTRRGAAAIGDGFDDISRGLKAAEVALYEEQLKDEERAVKNLEVEWSKKRREILFGDGTPNKPGFFSTAGEDTINGRKGVEDELNKARSQLLGKAPAGRVKQAFDLSSSSALQGELEQVDRYTIAQRKEANVNAANARIDEARQQASTYFSDDGKWNAAVDVIASEFAAIGDERGWSQEVINNETQKIISQTARERINRALITDAKSGAELYAKTKGMIDGDLRIEIEQDIKAAEKGEEVERRLAAAEQRQALADLDKAAFTEYASRIIAGEPVDPKAIALDSRMDGQSKFALANALEAKSNRPPAKDYGLFNNLFARIHLPENHPDKITDWKELNQHQAQLGDFSMFEQLRQEVIKQGTPEGEQQKSLLQQTRDNARKTLTGTNEMLGLRDPKGEELLQKATVEIEKAWAEGTKAGKSPYDMANPEHKDYVGKVINQLRRSPAQMMQDIFTDTQLPGMAPDEATPAGPGARAMPVELPVVTNDADFAKLPSGTKFKDPMGKEFTKP